jgi:hypothetical protein
MSGKIKTKTKRRKKNLRNEAFFLLRFMDKGKTCDPAIPLLSFPLGLESIFIFLSLLLLNVKISAAAILYMNGNSWGNIPRIRGSGYDLK